MPWIVERESKQEGGIIKKTKRREGEEKELQRIRKEAFRTTWVIYIEPLALRPLHVF